MRSSPPESFAEELLSLSRRARQQLLRPSPFLKAWAGERSEFDHILAALERKYEESVHQGNDL